MWGIKLAIFDIDGTLYDEDRKIYTPSAVEALKQLSKNGVLVVVATGRPPVAIRELEDAGIYPAFFICCNGHLVLGRDGANIVDEAFDAALAESVYRYCLANEIGLLWKYPRETYVYINHREFNPLLEKSGKMPGDRSFIYGNISIHLRHGPNGGCLACGTEKLAKFNEHFLGSCRGVDINGRLSDLLLWDVTKKTGLSRLLDMLDVSPGECIAFGDNMNDLEIISYVGTGVAMGNGTEELKRESDFVTTHISNDGIRNALRNFGLI